MNKGTKIRTVLAALTTINTVLAVTDITQFGNDTLTLWYKIISVIVNALVVAANTWYNNDYTEEACIGTGVARQLKAEKKDGYVGDHFYNDEDEAHEEYINDEMSVEEFDEEPNDEISVEELDEELNEEGDENE